ncbi:MAG: glycosyltransferase family 2 protein [Candidatus Cloacimonetes bacterium]|nr:glycosyltransferase family 2 protein [Candidatus Cloacimonadota bacterium]
MNYDDCKPMVSVLMITYNHEKFIRQAIEGVLMQKVDFEYELLIHDDASPDRTAEIIREYEAEYPKIVKPIYQTENQYSQGIDVSKFNRERAKGKYIASCEGDDYWIDPSKLQKLVNYLEQHPEYICASHNVYVVGADGSRISDKLHVYPIVPEYIYTKTDADFSKHPGQSGSLVYHNLFCTMQDELLIAYNNLQMNGDIKLPVLLTQYGDIFCFSDVMGCYRKIMSASSSWTSQNYSKNRYAELHQNYISLNQFTKKYFSYDQDNYELRFAVPIFSLLKYLRHPNRDNFMVFFCILNQTNENIDIIRHLFQKLSKNPLGIIKNIHLLTQYWKFGRGKFTV